MGQLLAFGIVHQEGGLAPQVARPPWLSTPVAMLLLLLLATTQSCLGPVHTNHQLHRPIHQPSFPCPNSDTTTRRTRYAHYQLRTDTVYSGTRRDVGTGPVFPAARSGAGS